MKGIIANEPEWALQTDVAELYWGGTSGPYEKAGAEGFRKASGVRNCEDRKQIINLRELRAFSLVLRNELGFDVKNENVRRLRLWIDNLRAHVFVKEMSYRALALMMEL